MPVISLAFIALEIYAWLRNRTWRLAVYFWSMSSWDLLSSLSLASPSRTSPSSDFNQRKTMKNKPIDPEAPFRTQLRAGGFLPKCVIPPFL